MGTKLGMTRLFKEDGTVVPVTLIQTMPNEILHKKTIEKDGYVALVVGFSGLKKEQKNRKYRFVKEFKLDAGDSAQYEKGQFLNLDLFKEGQLITLSGYSKGKGFAGVMKKWKFHGGPATHGSHMHRRPGSIGCRAKPGRIEKGKKMAGRMGGAKVTLKGREIVLIDAGKGVIGVKGAVPGSVSNLVVIS